MGIAVFIVKLPNGQRGNISPVVFQHGIDRFDVAACRCRKQEKAADFYGSDLFSSSTFPSIYFLICCSELVL